jgi:PHD/YefM family antitoxin component YafN of YafNO toxin-antitoxin module
MKENTVRLSFDVPEEEHILLKSSCALLRISIKDFLHEQMRKGLEELQEKQLQERLKASIKQSKEGRVKSRGSFSKYTEE